MISPCINIGIGKDGISCIEGLACIFNTRESEFPTLMSFLTVNLDSNHKFNVFNRDNREFEKYSLPDKIDDKLTENHVFIAKAYNDLISILNVLYENLQYTYVNINLIYSALESDLSVIELFGNIVKQYTEDGTFGTVVIKNYVIISDGKGILSTEEEKIITDNLSFIEGVRNENKIVDSIFVLDDKNLNTVFLGYNHEYLSFALYEFLIAIMTNQYKLISNLPGKNNLLSFGVGSIFFDKLYFNAFFDYRIFGKFLKNESISLRSKNTYQLAVVESVKEVFSNFYKDSNIDLSEVLNLVNLRLIDMPEINIGSYHYTLQLLLGIRKDRIVNTDDFVLKYNIKDLIFNLLHVYVLDNKNDMIGVEKAKSEQVKLYYQELELKELKLLEDNNYEDEIKLLEENIKVSKEQLTNYHKQLEVNFIKYKKPLERKYLKLNQSQDLSKRLEELHKKKQLTIELHRKKGCFGRFFALRSFKLIIAEINLDIANMESEIRRKERGIIEIQNALDSLYSLYEVCFLHNKKIEDVIDSLQKHYTTLENKWNQTPYIDYSFVQNIIDLDILKKYFKLHKLELTHEIKVPLNQLISKDKEVSEVKNNYILLSEQARGDIIDFYMANYMLGEYDKMELFPTFNFKADINKLKERGRPFINVIPTYTAQTHELFSIFNSPSKDKVFDQIKNYYSSAIPLQIDCPNRDRFLSINIESIVSVNEVAKSSKK